MPPPEQPPVNNQPPGLVSVTTQTPAPTPGPPGQHETPEEAGLAPAPGKKGKKVKPEKPGKAAVERPVLAPLTVGPSVPGSEAPPTPSPQHSDALFAFPPALV